MKMVLDHAHGTKFIFTQHPNHTASPYTTTLHQPRRRPHSNKTHSLAKTAASNNALDHTNNLGHQSDPRVRDPTVSARAPIHDDSASPNGGEHFC